MYINNISLDLFYLTVIYFHREKNCHSIDWQRTGKINYITIEVINKFSITLKKQIFEVKGSSNNYSQLITLTLPTWQYCYWICTISDKASTKNDKFLLLLLKEEKLGTAHEVYLFNFFLFNIENLVG